MRTITFIVMAVFMMTAYAQKSPVEKFIKKQSKADYIKVEEIDVSSKEFTAEMKLDGKAEEILAQVEAIKILTSDSSATASDRAKFMEKAKNALEDERYTELAVVKSDGDDVSLYAYPMDDGLIREMVVLVGGDNNALLVYMKGKLDMSTALSSELFSGMLGANKGKDCD